MKNPLILLAALVLTAPGAFAQTSALAAPAPVVLKSHHRMVPPEEMASHRSQKMAQQLGLSADQQSQLAAALLAERRAMTATAPAPADRRALHQAMQANHAQYEAQVKTILTPDQYARYTAMQQRRRDQHRAQRQQRTGVSPKS